MAEDALQSQPVKGSRDRFLSLASTTGFTCCLVDVDESVKNKLKPHLRPGIGESCIRFCSSIDDAPELGEDLTLERYG